MEKFGLLKYRDIESNMGDYVQSIAARKFLPNVDFLVSREELNKSTEKAKIILNGWFMHSPKNWPPNQSLKTKLISFHINSYCSEQLTSDDALRYYAKNEPVGCRDKFTYDLLKSKGIEVYFSGCLTLTLNKEDFFDKSKEGKVIFCDILSHKDDKVIKRGKSLSPLKVVKRAYRRYKEKKEERYKNEQNALLVDKLIPKDFCENGIYISNQYHKAKNQDEKFKKAEELLSYYASASLVVTSRIHCALPCLAFGTPVIFVRPNRDVSRFEGISDLFNTITEDEIREENENELHEKFKKYSTEVKTAHLELREKLIQDVASFIKAGA